MADLHGDGLFAQVYLRILLLSFTLPLTVVHGGLLQEEEPPEGSTVTISHTVGLLGRLEGLLVEGNGSDVALRVETVGADEVKVIQAHTLVLSLQSPVLEELLLARNGSTLLLRESAECAAVFHKFVRYMYSGELSLRLDQAIALHTLARKYAVSGLQQGLVHYMSQNLASDSPSSHVVGWYHYASSVGDAVLQSSCLQFLSWNLSSVLRGAEWASVSAELLLALLQRSDLVVHSELELFEAVEDWLARARPDGLVAENVLGSVRYAMVPPRQLFRLQRQSPVLQRYQESVRDLLYMSYQFHAASPLQLANFFDVNCSLFVPRNYLAPEWGVAWVISNPARDDRSTSFQTQLGPSSYDASKRVMWNVQFSPRWMPLSVRALYAEQGGLQPSRAGGGSGGGRPRIIITPATSSVDFAGVSFQKTVFVMAWQQGKLIVRKIYNFHQSTEETGDFLTEADLQPGSSEYLVDNALYLHIVVKPIYQSLIANTN